MKKGKVIKGIAALVSAALAVTVVISAAKIAKVRYIDREPTVTEKTLRFNEDGKFKILQIADLQDSVLFKTMAKDFMIELIEKEKPDLVVLTGDNIGDGSSRTHDLVYFALDRFMSIFEERGIKVAAVFGNHDAENNAYGKDDQIKIYQRYSCYVGSDVPELHGAGNYRLPILSSKEDKTAFNLWFFDSGELNDENDLEGYGCVHKDQIEWYVNEEKTQTEGNGGKIIPSMAFQHIIIPEVYDVLQKVENPEDEQYKDKLVAEYLGGYYVFPEKYSDEDTFFNETPCPPNYTNGQADALVENGKVIGIVVGHDHKNSFVIPYKGMDIIQSPTSGFGSYGDDNRGARVITLYENDPENYDTDVIFYRDIFDMEDEEHYYRFKLSTESGMNFFEHLKTTFRYYKAKLS